MIYIESSGNSASLNCGLRKIIKPRCAFPTDDAAIKPLNPSRWWTRPLTNWTAVISQFIIMYKDRVPIT